MASARPPASSLDATSRTPVVSARVSSGDRQVSTDSSGRFEIVIPSGHARLTASAPGYQDATVELGEATTDVEILLIARARFREQLEVTAEDTPDQAAVLPVRPRQVLTVAGAMDNVFRVLQTLPGVAATEEFGSRLSVRGGTPDQNLTVMDGVEIHNPYRLFGLTSAFNPETVERFELTAGGFGAKYGDRLSSLLIVDNRAGAPDRRWGGLVRPQRDRRQRHPRGKAPEGSEQLVAAHRPAHLLRPRGRALRGRGPARIQRPAGQRALGRGPGSLVRDIGRAQSRGYRRHFRRR